MYGTREWNICCGEIVIYPWISQDRGACAGGQLVCVVGRD